VRLTSRLRALRICVWVSGLGLEYGSIRFAPSCFHIFKIKYGRIMEEIPKRFHKEFGNVCPFRHLNFQKHFQKIWKSSIIFERTGWLRLAKAPQGIFFSDRWALNTFLLKKTPCYVWVHACNTMRFSVYFHVLCYFTCCCDVTTI